ncbi:MAG: RluA family pseudouridine synthase [Christensenellales bacterium]|jgi:23S rRNA pseudouridine1911/1915/1917 synthase
MEEIFLAKKEDEKKRLDVFLSENLDKTRSQIKKLIEDGIVLVDGKEVKAGFLLKENNEVLLKNFEKPIMQTAPEDIYLDVLYEDDDLAVINKQQGLVVHPAPGNYSGTLVNALAHRFSSLSSSNDVRPGIVHRLDKDTSGAMLVAKNDKAHAFLAKQIKDKTAIREYVALVSGNFKDDSGTITTGIGRDKNNRKKQAVYPVGQQKLAITHFEVLKRFTGFCLVKFVLETGRTHQIRVHSAHKGHPIVGDSVYGGNTKLYSGGQLLHSASITFYNLKNEQLSFKAPLPDYFEKVLFKLNQNLQED